MVVGQNGIFKKATTAKEETAKKEAEEEIRLLIAEEQTNKLGEATLADIVEALKKDSRYTYIVKFASTAMLSASGEVKSDYAENEEILGRLTKVQKKYM